MSRLGPRVSIVLPTYNRRDAIRRAVDSVLAQRFDDWELLVVDDGSTDGTGEVLANVDPRIRVLVQENRGVGGARNTGLAAARGSLIAFLDSDDEWPTHHLSLATAFFDAHPSEDAFTSEFWEDFGDGQYVKHFRLETGDWYPATARRIGSSAFETPPPHGDPYLWFYESRAPIGAWARPSLVDTPFADEEVYHYRGRIFRGWRWGWLMAMQPTVITRRAMETVGPIDTSYPVANDFGYLALLCRHFTMNFVSLPGCIKHELGEARHPLREGHLVTGRTATRFHQDVLRFHEELFLREEPDDPELLALRGFRHALVGRAALGQGSLDLALAHLREAVRTYPGTDTVAMLCLARTLPDSRLASMVYRSSTKAAAVARRLAGRARAMVAP